MCICSTKLIDNNWIFVNTSKKSIGVNDTINIRTLQNTMVSFESNQLILVVAEGRSIVHGVESQVVIPLASIQTAVIRALT